jgi:hypothetical protein
MCVYYVCVCVNVNVNVYVHLFILTPPPPPQSSGGAVQLMANRDIKAGELLTLSYGNLTNAELLLDYGWVG